MLVSNLPLIQLGTQLDDDLIKSDLKKQILKNLRLVQVRIQQTRVSWIQKDPFQVVLESLKSFNVIKKSNNVTLKVEYVYPERTQNVKKVEI